MIKTFLLLLAITIFYSCKNSEKETTENQSETKIEKKLFSETESKIKKYREDSQKYWDKNDSENALKYGDSIKSLILNSYIKDYEFKTVDSTNYNTSERKKTLFLQVTASWCAPCKFEVPALNKIVEKYSDKVDFVLLFWDTQAELEKLAPDYNKDIVLIPSQEKQSEATTIDISGFRHIMGFPTNYLITTSNEIINFSQGAMIPTTFTDQNGKEITITKEDADKGNYERLETEIKELIEKTGANTVYN
ncbi:thiol-disulfide isomerase/thioredoxin [Tenacibaculum skagerrakense]|uniref:Thiol-disulfide isomerase/thioredoxin n=1 Tax=Tenacibaculum skagerrakense TaxID=186571 RepID=A0A4R2NHN6_9FLAO|nr:thioredoxin family protein [Tenacibaculum skagerrakense]TCP20881.1 thiol-disulfide isomerase/thioredoxin [Tenacibaculum skagerrakense]